MEQITEFMLYGTGPKDLLGRWKARQEEMAALQKEGEADPKAWEERVATMRSRRITVRPEDMSADMKARLEEIAALTDKIWAARQEMRNVSHKEAAAVIEPETEVNMMACQGMEAHQEEEKPASLDTKPEAAQQEEVPVEDAEVIPVGEPKKKRRRDRKLAAEHRHQKTNTSTRENCGPQERLDIARRGTSHRAKVARKTPTDRKMRHRTTVARRMRNIFRPNTIRRAAVAQRKRNALKKENTHGDFRCQNKELAVDNCLHRLYKQPY
jgi:hypothetical protein